MEHAHMWGQKTTRMLVLLFHHMNHGDWECGGKHFYPLRSHLDRPHLFGFEWKGEPRFFLPLLNLNFSSFCTVCWDEGNLCTSTMTSSALSEGGKCHLSILSPSRFLSCILPLTHTLSGPLDLRSIHSGTDADLVSTNPDLIQLAVGSPFPSSLFH